MSARHIPVTRDGRKHRVGATHIRAAMKDAGVPTPAGDDGLLYIGRDDRGIELEIVAIPDDRLGGDRLGGDRAVIHAMPTYYRTKGERDEREEDQSC